MDGQPFYGYYLLREAERWFGPIFGRMRYLLMMYSLLLFRKHQSHHINVLYFVLAFNLTHNAHPSHVMIIPSFEIQWARTAITYYMNGMEDDSVFQDSLQYLSLSKTLEKFVEASFVFLDERRLIFEDFTLMICAFLAQQDLKNASMLLAIDSIYIFAHFFDPLENLFISPIEMNYVNIKRFYNIEGLFSKI